MFDELQADGIENVTLPKALDKPASFCGVSGRVVHLVETCN
jgi:hypothetical protein